MRRTTNKATRSLGLGFAVLLATVCLATICLAACEDKPSPDDKPTTEPSVELADTVDTAPRGVPRPADTFGAIAVDIDRVVLTARTPVEALAPDAGAGGDGDGAHPETWETSDPDWIASFIEAVGPDTKRIEKPPTDCRPWADLTLYSDQTASASFAVSCPRGRFTTLVTRPPTHVFVAQDKGKMARLLQDLRGR